MNKQVIIPLCALIMGIVMGSQIRCGGGRGGYVASHTDTVTTYVNRTDTAYCAVVTYVPKPYKVTVVAHDTPIFALQPIWGGNDTAAYISDCLHNFDRLKAVIAECKAFDSTRYYSDSLRRDGAFKAIISSRVRGVMEGVSVQWADLAPLEVRDIKNTVLKKQSLLKLYVGAGCYVGRSGADISPNLSLVIIDRYMVDLGYYMLHSQITAGAKIKLSFRR